MTPAGVAELVKRGHTSVCTGICQCKTAVFLMKYIAVGAKMLPTIEATYAAAENDCEGERPIAPGKLIKKGQWYLPFPLRRR